MNNHFNYAQWRFPQPQQALEQKFYSLVEKTFQNLPKGFFEHPYLHIDWMQNQQLYSLLKTMPKGVLHHDHFDCNQDNAFYQECILNDPIVYVNLEKKTFFIGTREQAEANGCISMVQLQEKVGKKNAITIMSSFTMMTKDDYIRANGDMAAAWQIFQAKIANFSNILLPVLHIFKKYVRHVLLKFIANGYQRIQFRALLIELTQYDQTGKIIKVHSKNKFAEAFDQIFEEIKKIYPTFSVGFVFFGLLSLPAQENKKIIRDVCKLNWSKTIGIDFVQQQDPYGSLKPYDDLANEVLSEFPGNKYVKIYHCGETKNHKNRNIQISLKAGSARIGHGNNVVQWPQVLQLCMNKNICFEKCLMSNLIFKYSYDSRFDASAFLFSIGLPISVNPDDPGKFGYEDTTCDFFLAAVSYNWKLRHFKAIGMHSIKHSITNIKQKEEMMGEYNSKWEKWTQMEN